jgi:hypothetical protein
MSSTEWLKAFFVYQKPKPRLEGELVSKKCMTSIASAFSYVKTLQWDLRSNIPKYCPLGEDEPIDNLRYSECIFLRQNPSMGICAATSQNIAHSVRMNLLTT